MTWDQLLLIVKLFELELKTILNMRANATNSNRIGAFGNANISNLNEWLELLTDNDHRAPQIDDTLITAHGRCPMLITGHSISIYYAFVGSEPQRQAKIITSHRW